MTAVSSNLGNRAVKERPILFSAPMVRGLLDDRKTQTRRVVKFAGILDFAQGADGVWHFRTAGGVTAVRCPYGVPGDRLWVREAWHYVNHQNGPHGLEVCVGYPADGEHLPNRPSHLVTEPERWADKIDAWPFKHRRWPGIHMPRWASRLTLEITGVGVERLNDCSEPDAIAEGIGRDEDTRAWIGADGAGVGGVARLYASPVRAYADLWDHINGEGAWNANPWVWVVEFQRVPALTAAAA